MSAKALHIALTGSLFLGRAPLPLRGRRRGERQQSEREKIFTHLGPSFCRQGNLAPDGAKPPLRGIRIASAAHRKRRLGRGAPVNAAKFTTTRPSATQP